MRRLVYYVATTIDGFIAGPDGGDPSGASFFPITPDLIAFIAEHYPETLPGAARTAMGIDAPGHSFDTVLEGRRSYDLGLAAGVTDAYPHLRHVVFSKTMTESPDDTVELVRDHALEAVRRLKAEEGLDLWLVGGGTIAHELLPEIDRLVLKVTPHIIRAGIPLFDGSFSPTAFRLVGEQRLESGIRIVTYDRA